MSASDSSSHCKEALHALHLQVRAVQRLPAPRSAPRLPQVARRQHQEQRPAVPGAVRDQDARQAAYAHDPGGAGVGGGAEGEVGVGQGRRLIVAGYLAVWAVVANECSDGGGGVTSILATTPDQATMPDADAI